MISFENCSGVRLKTTSSICARTTSKYLPFSRSSSFFADAIDRDQVVFVGLNHFLVQRSAGFAVIFAAFAVAENHVFHAQRSDHLSRNFAGVGAFGFGGAVLRSDGDAGSFGVLYDLGQVRKRRNYDEVHARANVAFQCGYAFQQFYAFRRVVFIFQLPATTFFLIIFRYLILDVFSLIGTAVTPPTFLLRRQSGFSVPACFSCYSRTGR